MLFISALTSREDDKATAIASIKGNEICYSAKHGILPEFFIEIMAQTMAAAHGYDALLHNTPPREGYIAGINWFTLNKIPDDSCDLEIQVKMNLAMGPLKIMEGEVVSGSESIAKAELKVWEEE